MLARDHRTHPNRQINFNKRDPRRPSAHVSSSNTGLIILHDALVADMNIATTAQCKPSRLQKDAGSVDWWMVVVVVGLVPRALVGGEGML